MTFRDDLINDIETVFFNTGEFASTSTYRAKGTAVDVEATVILHQVQDAETQKLSRGESYYANVGRLWCQIAEVANPRPGDTFVIDANTWIVQDVLGGNLAAWELAVYRSAFAGAIR